MNKVLENIKRCPVHELSPMHPDLLRCPAALNKRLRDEAPVFKHPSSGIYFISRFDDVVSMSQDPKTFSSVMGGATTRAVESSEPQIVEIMPAKRTRSTNGYNWRLNCDSNYYLLPFVSFSLSFSDIYVCQARTNQLTTHTKRAAFKR